MLMMLAISWGLQLCSHLIVPSKHNSQLMLMMLAVGRCTCKRNGQLMLMMLAARGALDDTTES